MSDNVAATAEGQSNEFDQAYDRLAREEKSGQAAAPRDDDRLEADETGDLEDHGQERAPPADVAAPAEPAPTDASDDIWADAPEQYREAFKAERSARERAEQASRSSGGRASRAEREATELRNQLAARNQASAPAAPQDKEKAPAAAERLKQVVEDYPDLAGPLAEVLTNLESEVSRLTQAQTSQGERQKARDEQELEAFLEAEQAKLADAHSDWEEVIRSPAFRTWVQQGPQFIRDGIVRNANGIVDGDEAIKILDLFRGETGQGATDPGVLRRQRQLDGGRAIPARVPAGTRSGEEPKTFDQAWDAMEARERRQSRQAA